MPCLGTLPKYGTDLRPGHPLTTDNRNVELTLAVSEKTSSHTTPWTNKMNTNSLFDVSVRQDLLQVAPGAPIC